MPDAYTARDKGPLTAQEARTVLREYRTRAGISVNTTQAQRATDHPMVQTILDELGHDQFDRCPVCRMRGGGVLRLDLPVGHPHFGRLVWCWSCGGG